MSKRNSFFIKHLLGSIFIALLVSAIVFFLFYPSPLAKALGVTHIFLMLLLIDVIIGPLLGFIVYKEGKKTLKLDLFIIIIFQMSALIYGVFNIYQGRPAAIAFQNYQFELVRFNDVVSTERTVNFSWYKPVWVAVDMGETLAQKNTYFSQEILTGVPAVNRPERYIHLNKAAGQILKEKHSLAELLKYNAKDNIDHLLKPYSTAVGWLPLRVMTGIDMVVLIDANGAVVNVVDLRPW